MPERYVENPGPNVMFVGGKMIPAGEGRMVVVDLAADDADQTAVVDVDALGELVQRGLDYPALLAKPLRELVPVLAGVGDVDLAELSALESARETPRSTLLNAIAAEQLTRAQARAGGATT